MNPVKSNNIKCMEMVKISCDFSFPFVLLSMLCNSVTGEKL